MKLLKTILCTATCVSLTHCADPTEGPSISRADTSTPTDRSATDQDARLSSEDVLEWSFADLDTDGDGFLSASEAAVSPGLGDIFSLADRDQDGRLNVPEYSHATLEGTRASADAARGPLFLALDTDENGRISLDEARAVPQLEANFAQFDLDDSGALDGQEYAEAQAVGLTPSE